MSNMRENALQNITPEALATISTELWDDPMYGQVAESFFTLDRRHGECSVWLTPRGYVTAGATTRPNLMASPLNVDTSADIKQVARKASQEVRRRHTLPFALALHLPQEQDEQAVRGGLAFRFLPGPLTHSHLKTYVKRQGWQNHRLHGTLGKSLDVLKMAVGYNPATERTAQLDDQEFITRDELRALAREAYDAGELDQYYLNDFSDKVSVGGYEQVRLGKPIRWGEVVLDGAAHHNFKAHFSWERVAVSSLVSIGLNAYRKNARGGPEFLVRTFGGSAQ